MPRYCMIRRGKYVEAIHRPAKTVPFINVPESDAHFVAAFAGVKAQPVLDHYDHESAARSLHRWADRRFAHA